MRDFTSSPQLAPSLALHPFCHETRRQAEATAAAAEKGNAHPPSVLPPPRRRQGECSSGIRFATTAADQGNAHPPSVLLSSYIRFAVRFAIRFAVEGERTQ